VRLLLRVPADRSIAGVLTVAEGSRRAERRFPARMFVCATATSVERHPATGRYRYRELRVNDPADHPERGNSRLVFEPEAGEAVAAEARGVLTLELFGGAPGADGRLRRTDRGLRVTDTDLVRLAGFLPSWERTTLDLEIEPPLPWWRWIARLRRRLSSERPVVADDASVGDRDVDGRGRWQDDAPSTRTSSSSSSETWSPRGGAFGGAGSGGGWQDGAGATASGSGGMRGATAAAAAGLAVGAAVAGAAAASASTGVSAATVTDETIPADGTGY
jgi:hypothetical protein